MFALASGGEGGAAPFIVYDVILRSAHRLPVPVGLSVFRRKMEA